MLPIPLSPYKTSPSLPPPTSTTTTSTLRTIVLLQPKLHKRKRQEMVMNTVHFYKQSGSP